jgi:4-aminobutyrate aminotransferase-like enzyme/Ser/Thr protein kinase RdoA (MazF antagonist)
MTSSLDKAPRLSTEEAARIGAELYGLTAVAEPLTSERDQNFLLKDSGGNRFVLKIANAEENPAFLDLQNRLIQFLGNAHLKTEIPRVVVTKAGEPTATIPGKNGDQHLVRVLTWLEGTCIAKIRAPGAGLLRSLGRALAEIDAALTGFSHPAAQRKFYWDLQHADMAFEHLYLLPADRRGLVESFFGEWRRIDWKQFRQSVIQNDASDYNILVNSDVSTGQRVTSILDYGDVVHTATACELAVAMAYVMLDKPDPIAAAAQVVAGYHEVYPLTEAEVDALYTLAVTRLCCSVCFAEHQKRQAPDNEYLNISNAPAWALLTKLEGRSPDWPRLMFRFACGFPVVKAFHPVPRRSSTDLLTSRRRHIGPSLSLAYQRPLHIVSGSRQYLYDSDGRRYLDCVNNVAHVGHSHPRVVRAASEQMAILNTNTRYVHELLVEYAERLTRMLPAPLSVAYLVCTGSEANELALRLARAHTRKDEVIVVQAGYHGNTNAMVDMSPYKFDGRGGRGRPAHVHKVPMPDVYRGPHRGEDAGGRYAQYVAEAAHENKNLAAFFFESALSCGGQIVLPPGYLAKAFAAVRAGGGVCVADEVQTGFGRAGSHFWTFETQGVVPDIVTLGKPIGNGHPLAAVITTPEIAQSFTNGMEYFNTFGGNPVSCAAGLAVLDVIRDEELQTNAAQVGDFLKDGLRQLQNQHPLIGDVRGIGLFLGIELVRNSTTLEPADREATEFVERMKDRGILLSTDGPLHNVIKIKPPLIFSKADAEHVLSQLASVLREGLARSAD